MATTIKVPTNVKLQVETMNGHDSDGNPTYTKKSFAGLKSDVAPADALAVGTAIGGVLKNGYENVYINTTELLGNSEE